MPRRCWRSAGNQLARLDCLAGRWIAQAIYFASRIERSIDGGHGAPGGYEEVLATVGPGMNAIST